MALLNNYTTNSGLELELYYSVSSFDVRGHIALDGYISKEARDEGKQPVNRITFNFDTAPSKIINGQKIESDKFILKSDINLENMYNFIKKTNEFTNSKDA